ncbi:Nvj1p LALA0_S02e03884g [Lachancea lanzarotensis]|uniref:LALA0S02e03884g1_1 n=1 Tax=Lachancea lanzarotensis TaxID=1245769 RepID=A0A0C7N333_9SACH|nr:uncharacterized protein LALA0_S02e03884g [Lachancea lanzarotensis]CEP60972.1 LALA0S02e03884g1_1 [Lachancea lanzarotensis]
MHSRPGIQNGVIFGAPLAVIAGLLAHFGLPYPQWLSDPVKAPSDIEPHSVVHICRCPEHSIGWPDVFQFVASQLTELTHRDWVSLTFNMILVIQMLLTLSKLWKKSFSGETTQLASTASVEQREADVVDADLLPYTSRERALLQFEKTRDKTLNFKFCNEDSWILKEDFLLPAKSVKPLFKDSPETTLSNLSPSTVVTSVGVQTSISQRLPPLSRSNDLHVGKIMSDLPSSPLSHEYPQLFTPKQSLSAALSSPPTSKTPTSPGFESRHAPAAVSLSGDPLVLETQNSSRTSFSSSPNVREVLHTPEYLSHAFHQPSPAKSTILKTEVTQEQVYSQPFIY